jgi:hypothetical protein
MSEKKIEEKYFKRKSISCKRYIKRKSISRGKVFHAKGISRGKVFQEEKYFMHAHFTQTRNE